MLILLAANVLVFVLAVLVGMIWRMHQRVSQLEKHRLEITREYSFTIDDDRIAAVHHRIFDELFGSLDDLDDEDAPPVTRH